MFRLLFTVAILRLATHSQAAPASSKVTSATSNTTLYRLHEVEKFDLSSNVEGPIGDTVVIGGINYHPFEYREPVGLIPQSPPKAIIYNPLDAYSRYFPPVFTCFMGDSITDHFDLHSFYFGCVLATADRLDNKTHSCDITLSAYTQSGSEPFVQQNVSFFATPVGSYRNRSQPMTKAVLEGFTGVYALAFNIVGMPEAPTGKTTALVIDNVDVDIFTTVPFKLPY